MKRLFVPNLERKGRVVRGLVGVVLLLGAAFGFGESVWLGVALAAAGVFALFEALRGWCAMRACGIKTRL